MPCRGISKQSERTHPLSLSQPRRVTKHESLKDSNTRYFILIKESNNPLIATYAGMICNLMRNINIELNYSSFCAAQCVKGFSNFFEKNNNL